MSVDTKAALDNAIAAHFGEAWDGAILTGYVLQMAGVTTADIEDGEQTSYYREVAEGQASHTTLGLLDYSHSMFRHNLTQRSDDD